MNPRTDVLVPSLLRSEFADIDELCATVRSWDLDFRPLAHATSYDQVGRIVQRRHGPIKYGYAKFLVSIEQKGAPPADCLTFAVPEVDLRRLWWRGRDVEAATVLVFPVGCELKSNSGPDFEIHTVSVTWETIAGVCRRLQLSLPPAWLCPETFCPPLGELDAFRRCLRRIRDRTSDDHGLGATRLIESLVIGWLGSTVTGREHPQPIRVRDRAIRKCLERIEQADLNELSLGVLCEIGEVGERTLQYAFRERFGLTPAAFLKMRRLAEARNRLTRAGAKEMMVGQVAASLEFWHVGQFAADYRRAFAEMPSQTLQRARGD